MNQFCRGRCDVQRTYSEAIGALAPRFSGICHKDIPIKLRSHL
jgi:hypothetical protein